MIALHSDGNLVIGTSTLQSFLTSLPNSAQILAAATTVLSNGVVVAGSIMTANAKAVTVAGTLSSLGTNILVEGASTIPTLAASITAAGQAVTVLANGDVIISSTTLAPVDPVITIAGTPISLGPQGLIVGASTIALSSSQPTSSITIGGQVFPMSLATNGIVDAGTTFQAGQPPITILGTPVALKPHGLVVGTSTIPYRGIVPSSTYGIGGFIVSGLNGGLTPPSKTGAAGSNQIQNNSTGAGIDPETFLGCEAKIAIQWSVFAAAAMTVLLT